MPFRTGHRQRGHGRQHSHLDFLGDLVRRESRPAWRPATTVRSDSPGEHAAARLSSCSSSLNMPARCGSAKTDYIEGAPTSSRRSPPAASATSWGRSFYVDAARASALHRLAGPRSANRLVREPWRAVRADASRRPTASSSAMVFPASGSTRRLDPRRLNAVLAVVQHGLNTPQHAGSWRGLERDRRHDSAEPAGRTVWRPGPGGRLPVGRGGPAVDSTTVHPLALPVRSSGRRAMIELNAEQRQAMAQGEPVHNRRSRKRTTPMSSSRPRSTAAGGDAAATRGRARSGDLPMVLRSMQGFWRDLPTLLMKRRNHKKWAAYHGDERVAIMRSDVDAYQECFRRGLKHEEIYVGW